MKIKFLIGILLAFSLFVCGQKRIENKLTENHQIIKGTKISLIVPEKFKHSQNCYGIDTDDESTEISIIEIQKSMSEVIKGIRNESFLGSNVEINRIENLIFNNLPAVFIEGSLDVYNLKVKKFILVFGNDYETIKITGFFPEIIKDLDKIVKTCILSAYYDNSRKIDLFESVDFTINPTIAGLTYHKIFKSFTSDTGLMIFTVDGKEFKDPITESSLSVTKVFIKDSIVNKKNFVEDKLKNIHSKKAILKYINEISIDGLNGCEVLAEVVFENINISTFVYIVVLFDKDHYYEINSWTPDNSTANMKKIKQSVNTFKRKANFGSK